MIAFTSALPTRLGATISTVSRFSTSVSLPCPVRRHACYARHARFFSVASSSASQKVGSAIATNKIMIFSKSTCPYCATVKSLFDEIKADYQVWELDQDPDQDEIREELVQRTGQHTVPNVFINQKHIGGCDDTMNLLYTGKLAEILTEAGVESNLAQEAQ